MKFPKFKREKGEEDKSSGNENQLNKKLRRAILITTWLVAFSPAFVIYAMLEKARPSVPTHEELASPPDKQASIIYSTDGVEMGRFWRDANRKSVEYNRISPYVISALIATEDQRYYDHAGIDLWGIGRAVGGAAMGQESGGASTISQQLAKLLYTVQDTSRGGVARDKWERLDQKFGENILAVRLEKDYTKEEIITMYLNNFDFLYNAVGISSASHVYFNTSPDSLTMTQAAMLVGMCKNPSMYNPLKFQYKIYEDSEEGRKQYERDSTRAYDRRNTVLHQWLKNSNDDNEHLPIRITQAQYDSLTQCPIEVDYQIVDHKEGIAPHFREVLRKELEAKFQEKDDKGNYKYAKTDGTPYDIYKDGLRIYTTIDSRMQEYAEWSVQEYMETTLQAAFDKNNAKNKRPPFANDASDEAIEIVLRRGMKGSDRYYHMQRAGASEAEIEKAFDTPVGMKVFSYKGDFDTVMTPRDSIIYYKSILQAGLMSMDPKTGFVKAWVGGPDFKHFAFDHVKQAKRQVGSTIKPFVYAAAMRFGVIDPCKAYADMSYCIDVPVSPTRINSWCPQTGTKNTGELIPSKCALAGSLNNITVAIMRDMGPLAGPQAMDKLLKEVGIYLRPEEVVPSMCLGPMDISLYNMVGAQSTFANKGMYIRPIYVMRIEDRNGNVVVDLEYEMKEAMNEELAYTMLLMMKGAVTGAGNVHQGGQVYATSSRLRAAGYPYGGLTMPIAGKTGTTNGASDGWFMGLTPDLVTGVWVGADDKDIHFRDFTWGQGARMALPIWGYYMNKCYKDKRLDLSKDDFEAPPQYDESIFKCSRQDSSPIIL